MKRIDISTKTHPKTFTMVDDEDFGKLNKYKWRAITQRNRLVVTRTEWDVTSKKHFEVYMHREIMGLEKGDKTQVDHRDHNTLDNRRYNLRHCNASQNAQNKQRMGGHSSKYKGVSWFKRDGNWRSYIKLNYQNIHIGYFELEIDAAKAYDQKAKALFGEFAYLNFGEAKSA